MKRNLGFHGRVQMRRELPEKQALLPKHWDWIGIMDGQSQDPGMSPLPPLCVWLLLLEFHGISGSELDL